MLYLLGSHQAETTFLRIVLILVVMDALFIAAIIASLEKMDCLNPCCNGCSIH